MSLKIYPAPACDRREALCVVTRTCQYSPFYCKSIGCSFYRENSLAADARRQAIFADLRTMDPSLNVEPRIFLAGGGS